MADRIPRPPSSGARVAALAREQRGSVTRDQLLRLGYGNRALDELLRRGVLHRLYPGVYAHGHSVLTRDGWLMVAALACGPESHLAARAAASARGLLRAWSTIDVITPTKRGVGLPGIRAIRAQLRAEERDVHRGLPVTSLARTALDVAAREGYHRTGELLDEALLQGQYDHAEMLDLLDARRGCRGVATLRSAVSALGDEGVVFRSRAERLARDLIRDAGLQAPKVNAWFPTRAGHGHELDLWWPGLQLDFELDGPHHRQPHQRRKDALRDADLRAFGVTVVRFASEDVARRADAFLELVAAALRSAACER